MAAWRKYDDLPREICIVSLTKACHDPGTDEGGNRVTAMQKSAEGIKERGNEPIRWKSHVGRLTSEKRPERSPSRRDG